MRILHTSDWHLGRSFHGASLLDEQAEAMERVVELAAAHQVDLVVVAGDLFDRAIPPVPAVDLLDTTLARLRATGARVAAISGNHDSAVRVRVHDRLLNELGVALRGEVARVDEPLLLDRPTDGGPPVAVYLVPFLEPSVDAPVLAGGSAAGAHETDGDREDRADRAERRTTHDGAMRLAMARVRDHLAGLGSARSVVVAHAFVAGGRVSDSERDLSVGGSDRVAEATFDGVDLVALGHLHHPQEVAGPRLAYSGSPLPYSFSEEGQEKSVRVVELGTDGSVVAEVVRLGAGRPVRTLAGTLEQLLTDPAHEAAVGARVRVRLTDAHLPDQAMARLRRRFPHALELRHEPPGRAAAGTAPARRMAELEAASPLDLALRFWADQQGAEATPAEAAVLERAVAATAFGARS